MNFFEAIASGFRNYVNFSGRAQRSAYWYWALYTVVASFIGGIMDGTLFPNSDISPIGTLVSLSLLLPSLAVGVRRLHDIDRSGWWLLISFVPFAGFVVLLVFFCQEGNSGPNQYGPNPLAPHEGTQTEWTQAQTEEFKRSMNLPRE